MQLQDETDYQSTSLSSTDFTGQQTKNVTFDQVKVSDSNFSGTKMTHLYIKKSTFQKCDLSNAQWNTNEAPAKWNESALKESQFEQCRMTGIQLNECALEQVTFDQCKIDYAQIMTAQLKKCQFDNCDLKNTFFESSTLTEVSFINCNLTEADFSFCKLKKVDLRGSIIEGIKISLENYKHLIVDPSQAMYLAQLTGMEIQG